MMRPNIATVAAALCALALKASMPTALAAEPAFNRDVRPILADHCFNCHGQDAKTRKGRLRLDTREGALAGGKSGHPAIVPGKPEESELIARVASHDPDKVMPPAEAKNPVSAQQIDTLRRWIASGAEYQGHWAFAAPARPPVPRAELRAPISSPIDAFVLAELDKQGLAPSPEATPEALCRRLHLDLVGLPPSLETLDAFAAAWAANPERAYGDLVNELLASPRFGEKWARWWLDAARYADSDGYEKDLPRDQWPWRDWVIRRLNEDMPYDRFVVEQIAGDLLPNATQEQRVATGFFRNGMVNEEGAIIFEQFRLDGMFDRMDAVGKSVLGLTLQCAQCHSHKFDPLTQEEYYRLMAFFNNTHESVSRVYTRAEQEKIDHVHREIAAAEADLKAKHPDWQERLAHWEESVRENEVKWETFDAIEHEWVGGLAHPEKIHDKSILTLGFRPTTGELFITALTHETNITGLRLEALTHGDLPFTGPGRGRDGSFAVSEFYVEAAPLSVVGTNTNNVAEVKSGLVKIPLTNAWADIETEERPISRFSKGTEEKRKLGPARYLIDGSDDTAWSSDLGPGRRHTESQVVMQFATNGWMNAEGTFLKIWLKFRHGGADAHGRDSMFLGRFRVDYTTACDPLADKVPRKVRDALRVPPDQRSSEQQQLIFAHWRGATAEFADWNKKIDAAWKEFPEGGSVLNLAERAPEFRRETRILERGNWNKPGQAVEPGVPAFLHELRAGAPRNRLGFAEWLVDPRSPTTARVAANRAWQAIFGQGLLETPEDFGVRAPLPTHPELLDWLAMEFMQPVTEGGRPWSLKHLVRLMVTSATYRQSSATTPDLLERDPRNRWLARAPRFRAESEVVRDIALSSSGLLHEQLGGPSFYPPVPESLFALNFVKLDWKAAPIPERHRRSLYMFRRRSMPDPVMSSFDAPNGDFSCVRRMRSNTPLAALAAMNEPVFVEAAQALALRTLREAGSAERDRIDHAFRLCTSRAPRDAEAAAIGELLESRRARLAEGWISPRDIAFANAELPSLPPGVTPREVAAWTIVARVLLNMDETMSKQ